MNHQDPLKDRSISITQFVDNRSVQIQQFIKILNEKTCAKKVRLVPKNIRRRAMSHNRYRIPLRHRVAINSELKTNQSMQKIPRCRKTIRKKHLLIKQYKKRLSKVRWLGNHLWSAKRMRMIQYFGYKIGLNPNQKSDRASYRFSRYGCCLMNLSFYEILLLKFQQNPPMQILQKFFEKIPEKQSQYTYSKFYLSGKFICPVTIYKNNLQFIILYHPAARQQIDQLTIPGCSIEVLTQKVEIYRLMGHQSLQKIDLLLNNIGYKSESGSTTSLLKNKINPCFYDNNLTFQIDITGCKCENKLILSPSKAITEYIKQDYEPSQIQQTNFSQSSLNEKDYNLFWKHAFSQSNYQGKFEFSTRSKYTHKRKDKMTKQQKQKMIKQNPLAIVTPKKQKDKMIEEKQQFFYEIKQPLKEKIIPERRILISLINNNSDTDGCLLIFSNFDFSYIWRKLTFLNCKVIGLQQYETILNQNQQRVYPRDYPQTPGYSKWFTKQVEDKIMYYRRKPQAKVANYQQLHSPFPFGITVSLFNTYLRQNIKLKKIKCISVGRGTIPAYSYICRPTKIDIDKLKNYIINNEGVSFVYKQQQTPTQKINRKQMLKYTNSQLIQYFMNTKMDRQLIGFITSGGVNLKISKGCGLGQIRQDYFLPYVLIRKPASPFYFLAEVFY